MSLFAIFPLALITFVLIHTSSLEANPLEEVQLLTEKNNVCSLRGIDSIFLINLDSRPEKLQKSLLQLAPYKISINRFGAVNGWKLNQKEIDSIIQPFNKGMMGGRWASKLNPGPNPQKEFYFLDKSCQGQSFASVFLTQGAIGCFMSHLSIIKNAYEMNLQRIWILEDDFKIVRNPNEMSSLIDKLNHTVGDLNWDLLYTDFDAKDAPIYYGVNDFKSELKGLDLAWFWRPDLTPNRSKIFKREIVSDDFLKIGSRMRTHSYILNRSGMKKIIDFYQTRGLFVPYDHELAIIPNLNLYSLTYDVVSFEETVSDTRGTP